MKYDISFSGGWKVLFCFSMINVSIKWFSVISQFYYSNKILKRDAIRKEYEHYLSIQTHIGDSYTFCHNNKQFFKRLSECEKSFHSKIFQHSNHGILLVLNSSLIFPYSPWIYMADGNFGFLSRKNSFLQRIMCSNVCPSVSVQHAIIIDFLDLFQTYGSLPTFSNNIWSLNSLMIANSHK